MPTRPDSNPMQQLQQMVEPWQRSIQDPFKAQQAVLEKFIAIYAHTTYGRQHGTGNIGNIQDFQNAFPVQTYEEYKPLIQQVMAGEIDLLLNEQPVGWAITRGTSKGEVKFIPMTPTDLKMRVSAGRAVVNFALRSGCFELFQGVNLNLNFPSVVGSIRVGEKELEYGYSSGIYTRHVSALTPVRSVPSQDEIDALGGGKTQKDWDARFELAYTKCLPEKVTLVGGVAPTALQFGRYLRRTHRHLPKDKWNVLVMTLGSVPGINTRLAQDLWGYYGQQAAIREIYGATEGMFGQQMDEKRAWVPNYDLFFFEVQTRQGVKMLHEMKPGESGSLIVSTPIFPRYQIGDRILAFQAPYFRCIGRNAWTTPLKYAWGEFNSLNLGRL